MFDRHPAIIARCAGAADVVSSVNFARAHDLLVAVRGGGHSLSGQSACDGGLMIDLSPMRTVRVDPLARRAFVGAGSLLGDLDREIQRIRPRDDRGHGVAHGRRRAHARRRPGPPAPDPRPRLRQPALRRGDHRGRASSCGPARRKIRDLFWALRGGGGNFGVVTSFEYELYPFGGTILGGAIIYPFEQARDVYNFYADFTRQDPRRAVPDPGAGVARTAASPWWPWRRATRVISPKASASSRRCAASASRSPTRSRRCPILKSRPAPTRPRQRASVTTSSPVFCASSIPRCSTPLSTTSRPRRGPDRGGDPAAVRRRHGPRAARMPRPIPAATRPTRC